MSTDEVMPSGYDREQKYFYELNKKLIEKRRKALNAQREAQEAIKKQEEHWLTCPKCGGRMAETDVEGIKVDQCDNCEGVFFDRGELQLLLECQKHAGFLRRVGRLVRKQ